MPEIVSITGLSEVKGFLERLKFAPSPERLREPFFRAAELYQQDVRLTLPALYRPPSRNGHRPRGNLIRGLRRGGRISLSVGFYYVDGRMPYSESKAANHAHLIDQGTADRYTRAGKYRGHVTPTFFWTGAKQRQRYRAQSLLVKGIFRTLSSI